MSQKLLAEQFPGVVELGIKIEKVGGLTVWEAQPVFAHQVAVDRIRATLHPTDSSGSGCAGIHVADVSILFPDGSEKRPDISVFCRMPDEQESAVTLLPEAVIEVISKGYEAKDYEVGVPFYLTQGIRDIITFDPRTQEVRHFRRAETLFHTSPVEIVLECGCVCTV